MVHPPKPENEAERLAAVIDLTILDTPPEERFDRITKLATILFNVPISTLTIMDTDREWYKSCQGVDEKEHPRTISFCDHAIASEKEMLVIKDAKEDPRFFDNPMVIGPPYIRFYAGVPIFSLTGEKVGVFCIKDIKPRTLDESKSFMLQTLASWAEVEVNIVSLKNILGKNDDKEKLKPILERLVHRNVFENLKSIKFGIRLKLGEQNLNEAIECESAIGRIIDIILKIQNVVES